MAKTETTFHLSRLVRHLGPEDALLVTGPDDRVLVAVNAEKPSIPASTLKVFTALVALKTLGPAHRFQTEIFLDTQKNLVVKGYGDPLLTSESMVDLAAAIAGALPPQTTELADLLVDDTYFAQPIIIPGVSPSLQPYDAPNGAFCANFNTVYFQTRKGRRVSAEPQTPLVDFARRQIPPDAPPRGRITLTHDKEAVSLYAGHLLARFLADHGIIFTGKIRRGEIPSGQVRLLTTYRSPVSLSEVVKKMLEFSNNFIANQLLITTGAATLGAPGTLEKGVRAASQFAYRRLAIQDLKIVEGSGISRENRIRATQLDQVLKAFLPYRELLRSRGGEQYKTGTLNGIHTRAGYIDTVGAATGPFRYVVFTTGRKNVMARLMDDLRRLVGRN